MTAVFPVTETIARFAIESRAEQIPATARRVMKLSLLDWCACAIAGRDEPVGVMTRAMIASEGGAPNCTVVGMEAKAPARAAALANGATSHALDYDDTHFDYIGHTSVAIVPSALAVAEERDASGRAFIDAALFGAETACRVGAWLGARHYHHGFHQTATSGTFGAAAAACRLLDLDVEATRHAFGLATTRASGLKTQFGTMGKPFNAGIAASNGVECGALAALGFVSRPDGLECALGFAATHAGEADAAAAVFAGLGETFRFELVQHKFHACCHGTHAALESLIAARDKGHMAAADIAGVTIYVHPHWLSVCDIPEPRTGLEAKFSYRLTTAMVLAGLDTGALDAFSQANCANPTLVALRDLTRAEGDPTLNDTSARVRVMLRSGRVVETFQDLNTLPPLDAREGKIRAKATTLLGRATANALWDGVNALEHSSTREFAGALRRASQASGVGRSAS